MIAFSERYSGIRCIDKFYIFLVYCYCKKNKIKCNFATYIKNYTILPNLTNYFIYVHVI